VINKPGTHRPGSGEWSLPEWLGALGSAAPTPGGGAAAAMNAALGAALVEMVCSLTAGKPAYAQHEQHAAAIRDSARKLRLTALTLVDDDAAAFAALMAAYRMPKASPEQEAERVKAIQAAAVRAAAVPLETAGTAAEVAQLAAQLPGRSNPNVLSDVGVAAVCAAAAIESAAINVEVNLAVLTDDDIKTSLAGRLAGYLTAAERARQLAAMVRGKING
jgi:methenyltetrahydrofolate cyclohydrolase